MLGGVLIRREFRHKRGHEERKTATKQMDLCILQALKPTDKTQQHLEKEAKKALLQKFVAAAEMRKKGLEIPVAPDSPKECPEIVKVQTLTGVGNQPVVAV